MKEARFRNTQTAHSCIHIGKSKVLGAGGGGGVGCRVAGVWGGGLFCTMKLECVLFVGLLTQLSVSHRTSAELNT